jgi:beta-lactamase regulating signal transducer with metallopeptidase domain
MRIKPLLDFLVVHGPILLMGVTALLGLATLLVIFHRQPIHRQRIAEASMVLCAIWLVLACVPLPRFALMTTTAKPAPAGTLPLYSPQPGDEVIAAEVFKVPRENAIVKSSTGIAAPLRMPRTPSVQPTTAMNWPLVLARFYVGGVLVCGLYSILGHLLLHRLLMRSRRVEGLELNSKVRVRICAECDRPVSFGLWRPTILLPMRFTSLDHVKQQHILHHELAHISQRDALGHFLFNLLFPLLYVHPLYWLLRRKTNLARELIADDLAAAQSSREAYVADLLALARERLGNAALATHALGLFQSKTDLYRRMHMLMQSNGALERRCSLYWRMGYSTALVVALMLLAGTLGVRRANAQAADPAQIEVEKRDAQEKTTLAAERDAELVKLRAQQDQIQAQLKALEVERQQLQSELDKRRGEGAKTDDVASIYRRTLMQREQAIQQVREAQAAELAAKDQNAKANDERAAMRDWMNKRNAVNADQKEAVGRGQLDLVSLADRYVDAMGGISLAEVRIQAYEQKGDVAGVRVEKVNLDTAKRKVAIFRGIAEAARESAKADFELTNEQVKNGIAPKSSVLEAQSRLRMLEVILAH